MVTEEDAAAIRAAFEQGGEFSAAIEFRRRFPLISDHDLAHAHARTIAGWQPARPTPAGPETLKSGKPGRRHRAKHCP